MSPHGGDFLDLKLSYYMVPNHLTSRDSAVELRIILYLAKQRVMRKADVQGQPQCRRKETITGFPFLSGIGSLEDEGALDPISGTGDICRADGLCNELSS